MMRESQSSAVMQTKIKIEVILFPHSERHNQDFGPSITFTAAWKISFCPTGTGKQFRRWPRSWDRKYTGDTCRTNRNILNKHKHVVRHRGKI
jgi:hypothetical protein